MINITEKAAAEIKRVINELQQEKTYLRARVVGGGCAGFQSKLDIDDQFDEKKDELFQVEGVEIVVDKRSLVYLTGATIDFSDDLNRRGFMVNLVGISGSCGCGSSFSM